MIHAPVYMAQPYGGPAKCGSPEGARTDDPGGPKRVDCPDCLRILAEEDAAWVAKVRGWEQESRAIEAVTMAIFGWLA